MTHASWGSNARKRRVATRPRVIWACASTAARRCGGLEKNVAAKRMSLGISRSFPEKERLLLHLFLWGYLDLVDRVGTWVICYTNHMGIWPLPLSSNLPGVVVLGIRIINRQDPGR